MSSLFASLNRNGAQDAGSPYNIVPDFAIVGAPKCGTTSLFMALKRHPQIMMSYIKEPTYFATDLPGSRQVVTASAYQSLFRSARPGVLKGEASVLYLYSQSAIPELLQHNPRAKLIAFVRNPIEVYISFHNELLKHLDEDEPDPEQAWKLQEARAEGHCIPATCKERLLLQYKHLCSLGEQVQRLKRVAPAKQIHIIVFDDLVRDPGGCMRSVLSFLGVPPDSAKGLPRTNEFTKNKSLLMARFLRWVLLQPYLRELRLRFKPVINNYGFRPIEWLGERNLAKIAKPPIGAEFRRTLVSAFEADVALLEGELGRRFDHWFEAESVRLAGRGFTYQEAHALHQG